MKIKISSDIYLAQITKEDKPSLLKYINDKEIYNNTLKIPYPYKERHADEWINHIESIKQKKGILKSWAVKNKNELIGGIAFHSRYGENSHKDEIGYWLGKPFWGKGIMTEVVKKICSIGFTEFNLIRIEAIVFSSNIPSGKVLKKAGFMCEGTLRKYYYKDNRFIDADIYSKLI